MFSFDLWKISKNVYSYILILRWKKIVWDCLHRFHPLNTWRLVRQTCKAVWNSTRIGLVRSGYTLGWHACACVCVSVRLVTRARDVVSPRLIPFSFASKSALRRFGPL